MAPGGLFGAASGKSLKSGAVNANINSGKLNDALSMIKNGSSPSEVFNATGLVVQSNGDIQDGINGDVIWRSNGADGNRKGGRNSGQDSSLQSGAQGTVLQNDGRTDSGAFQDEVSGDRGQEARRGWKDLSDDERSRFEEIVARHADEGGTRELSELRDTTSDAFVAERIYDDLQSGDAAAETWIVYFNDLPSLLDELKSITSSQEAAGAPVASGNACLHRVRG